MKSAVNRPASGNPAVPNQSMRPVPGWLIPLLCLGLGVLVFVTFLPAVRNGFVNFDDPLYVTDNPYVQKGFSYEGLKWALGSTASSNWHPLTWISYMADFDLYGLKPWGYHLTNVLLHAVNTCLTFLVLRRLTSSTWRSFAVAALFGLHPLRVESVAWVAERKDVLSALFFFLTVWAYTRYIDDRAACQVSGLRSQVSSPKSQVSAPKPSDNATRNTPHISRFYFLALAFFALGLMSKPMLVTLPFVLLLLDYWPLGRFGSPLNFSNRSGTDTRHPTPDTRPIAPTVAGRTLLGLALEKLPFFVLSAASCVVTFLVQRQAGAVAQTLSFTARAENSVVAYCRYLGRLFWPADLCVLYPHPDYWPWQVVAGSGLVFVVISALVFVYRSQRPYLIVGWLWFVGTLVPVIGLVQVGQQSMADRYTYLPMVGIVMAIVWGLCELTARWRQAKAALLTGLVLLSLGCFMATHAQLAYWKDGETLFRRAIAVTTNNALAHGSLARALADKGQVDEAIIHYREAATLDLHDTISCNGLGNLLAQKGDLDGATSQFQEALRRRPGDSFAHNNLGLVLARKGMSDAALAEFQEAVNLNPDEPEPHHNLGLLLANKGQVDEAIVQYLEAIRLKPDYAKAHKNLGVALARKGNLDAAIGEFQAAIRLLPDYAEAEKYLEAALQQKANGSREGR